MVPCRRVKIDRAALNNAAEPKAAVPRRRRLHESLNNHTAAPKRLPQEKTSESDSVDVILAASYSPHQTGSGNETEMRGHGELERSRLGPRDGETVRRSKPAEPGAAGSEGFSSKAAESSFCHPSLESKYCSHQLKCFGKQNSQSVRSDGSPAECKTPQKNTETGTSNIVFGINQFPRVVLCDFAKSCDSFRCNCGCLLPAVLRTRSVHCFRKDMRARFQFPSECFRHNKHEPLVKKESGVQLNGNVGEGLTKYQKHLNRGADSQIPSNHTTSCFPSNSASEDSAVSGSVLGRADCNGGGDVDNCSFMIGAEIHRKKRIRLEDRINPRGTLGSDVEENAERGDPTKAHRTQKLSKYENDIAADHPESYTCQRVRVYLRKRPSSCARAYMPWPFVNGVPDHPSPRNASKTANQPQSLSPCREIDSILSNTSVEDDGERWDRVTSYQSITGQEKQLEPFASHSPDLMSSSTHGKEPGTDGLSSSSLPFNGTAPSPAAIFPGDGEINPTLSPVPSAFSWRNPSCLSATPSSHTPLLVLPETAKGVQSRAGESSCSSLSSPPHSSDSSNSSLLLPQQTHKSDEELSKDRLPKLTPFTHTITAACTEESGFCSVPDERPVLKFFLPPVLSPLASPQRDSWKRSFSRQSSGHSDAGTNEAASHKNETLRSCRTSQIAGDNRESSKDCSEDTEGVSSFKYPTSSTREEAHTSPSSGREVGNSSDEERGDETDFEDDAERGNGSSEQDPTDPKTKTSPPSGALTDPRSSPSSDDGSSTDKGSLGSAGEERSSPSLAGSEGDQTKAEAAGGAQPGFLDEFTAYEQDILLVDVTQDDPELFDNLPEESLLRLGPVRETIKSKPQAETKALPPNTEKTPVEGQQRWTPITMNFLNKTEDVTDEGSSRPWRPQYGVTHPKMQHNKHPDPDKQSQSVDQADTNNNQGNGTLERSQAPVPTTSFPHNSPLLRASLWITNSANTTDCRRPKSNAYCRRYFSESLPCGFRKCHFLHLPADGDEKFCIETVARFSQNPLCIQKAGAVYTGYYQNNPPGVHFSMPVLLSLLWALLKAGMVTAVFSVLKVSLAHNILPGYDFLLALFNHLRENGLKAFVPELMQLMFKMTSSGLDPSLNSLNCVKNALGFQQNAPLTSPVPGNDKLSASMAFPEDLNLAHTAVEIELCIMQKDWRQLGVVFSSICQFSQHPHQVERISGRVAVALLSESKDKLSLPFAAFVETAFQNGGKGSLIQNFVGRIGVSLMLRYHKTQQWVKGRRVVETLALSKVDYSTLRSLFGNEDRASRCCLITVATELFLMSGSVEGALKTLRENKWFLSSCLWPCEPADLEGRTRVLYCLAEKTSHRDKLEVLCNLPGVQEPNGLLEVSKYSELFNAHLQTCVDRQLFPVAVDTVDFMLSKKLLVVSSLLQVVLDKLGRQNHWLRAREVFRRSLSLGYYPEVSAPPGLMTLTVPCRLGKAELVLAFEMFIAINATPITHAEDSSALTITLKRTQSSESEYLSAGSRLLSAASVPQPKLYVHYKAVNSSQEQVFLLDCPSARRWLRSNRLWASDVWKQ